MRSLSSEHGVSISTVQQAYHIFEDRQLISPQPRSGYFVTHRKAQSSVPPLTRPAQTVSAPKATSSVMPEERSPDKDSPRDMLANMGITCDENGLRSAIERGDSRVIRLFMQGGMSWKASFAESALGADYRDALTTLLQYRTQMDELRPCRRMVNTISQAMKDG